MFAPALAASNDGFRPESFAALARLEAGHFWFRGRNRLLIWALKAYFPTARSFLEIGCGTGFVLTGLRAACPDLALAGSEIHNEGLSFARSRLPDVPLFQLDARSMPFDADFDVVGAFDVLEHVDEDEAVLRQMFQAVQPGGGVLITVPQHQFLWSVVDEESCHKRRYSRRDLVDKVERAGFQIARLTSFVSVLLPLVWFSRRVQNWRSRVGVEMTVRGLLGTTLERVMDLERMLIAAGASFPVGVSLLLVAKRIR